MLGLSPGSAPYWLLISLKTGLLEEEKRILFGGFEDLACMFFHHVSLTTT